MNIVRAESHQLSDLVPLFDAYRIFYRQPSDRSGAHSFLKERINNKESVIFIAYMEERAIGFTQLYPIYSSVSMEPMYLLNDLYVTLEQRGKGVGQALIGKAKELCIEQNYKGLALQTEADNPAQKLYEHLGFNKDPDLHYFWTNNKR